MKLWQKIVLAATAIVAAAALTVCGVLIVKQQKLQEQSVAAMATANKEQKSLKAELDSLRQQLQAQEEMQAESQKAVEALQKKLKETEEKLKAAETEQEKLKEEKASLQQQIDLMGNKTQSGKTEATKPIKPIAGKVAYLTFDDGPSDVTPTVLKTLKKYNVKATFFVVGTSNLDYIKEIHKQGHAIALHCNSHDYSKVYASEAAYLSDLKTISKKVEDRIGVKSMVVRFPGGSSNTISRNYTPGLMSSLSKLLPKMGYAYFDWNVSSGDATPGYQSASKIANNVLRQAQGVNKICVLMHDGSGKQTTAQALPTIIEGLQKQGFSFAVLTPEVEGFKHGVNN